jgi:hypothetical protein
MLLSSNQTFHRYLLEPYRDPITGKRKIGSHLITVRRLDVGDTVVFRYKRGRFRGRWRWVPLPLRYPVVEHHELYSSGDDNHEE